MYLRYLVKMKSHISYFYNAFLEYYPLHQAWCETNFIKYREDKLTVSRYVQNGHQCCKHKHASVLAIGQLCHQSATALSLATHAGDAVTAHQCHEHRYSIKYSLDT